MFSRFESPNFDAFLIYFWLESENVDFVKISVSPRREHDFQGFEELKINKKNTKKGIQNKDKKTMGNITRKHRFLDQNSLQKRSKIKEKPNEKYDEKKASKREGQEPFGQGVLISPRR